MINKEVYENITEEKLCFCDSRPDVSIMKVIDYYFDDEQRDYRYGEGSSEPDYEDVDHIYHDLLQIVLWMRHSRKEVQ
ncbi:hypothetical protein N9C41_01835 [Candidatus Marinimicrobia bacterium]|nr:hypothetical protein [Candidatus Neomarinimicrobiota bacterium]